MARKVASSLLLSPLPVTPKQTRMSWAARPEKDPAVRAAGSFCTFLDAHRSGQYSLGSSKQVDDRSASVMIQMRWPDAH